MFSASLFRTRRVCAEARPPVSKAAAALIQSLESRQLLATYPYTVPSGHTAAYLEPKTGGFQGQIEVRLDSPTATPVDPNPFDNTTGMDVITAPFTGFKFYDQVPAVDKPTSDGTDSGVKVQGGSSCTLEVDAVPSDFLMQVSDNTSVELQDGNGNFGFSRLGSGIDHLTLRPNNQGGAIVEVPSLASGIHLTIDTGQGVFDQISLGDNSAIQEQVIVKTGAGDDTVNVEYENSHDLVNAIVDFGYGTHLGLGNVLNVQSAGIAHLAKAPGTSNHTVYVDEVNVSGESGEQGTLLVDDASTIGTLHVYSNGEATIGAASTISTFTVDSGASASIEAPSIIDGTFTVAGTAEFTGTSASSTVHDFGNSTGTVNVDAGADVTVFNDGTIGTLNVSGIDALILFNDSQTINNLNITDHGLTKFSESGEKVLDTNALSIDSTGVLDLTDNSMLVHYTTSSPDATIRGYLIHGYHSGAWDGIGGINSSTAAAVAADSNISHKTALGYLDQPSNHQVLVEYTFYGDANLDRTVDTVDYNIMAGHFGQSNMEWGVWEETCPSTDAALCARTVVACAVLPLEP